MPPKKPTKKPAKKVTKKIAKKPAPKPKPTKKVMPRVEFVAYFPGIQGEYRSLPEGGGRLIFEFGPRDASKVFQFKTIMDAVGGEMCVTMEIKPEKPNAGSPEPG